MIGSLSHIAIAVPDLSSAILQYQNIFGAFVTSPQELPDHGIRLAVVNLSNTKIELISPLGDASPIQKFLERNPQGGIHHLCYEVSNIKEAQEKLQSSGIHVVGDGVPKLGYRGNNVLFFNPKDALGVLIEIEEAPISKGRVEVERIGPVHTVHKSSIDSLDGVEGVQVEVDTDFRELTPRDNKEGD